MTSAEAFYTVTTSAKKNGGTFTNFAPNEGTAVTLDASVGNTSYIWIATKGKLVTKGTTGSMSVEVVPEKTPLSGKPGKGNVEITGTWSCDAF